MGPKEDISLVRSTLPWETVASGQHRRRDFEQGRASQAAEEKAEDTTLS